MVELAKSPLGAMESPPLLEHILRELATCKVQMARGVNSLFKILQASLNNNVSIKDGEANSSTSTTTLCKPPIQF
jgi:hypothetical protein